MNKKSFMMNSGLAGLVFSTAFAVTACYNYALVNNNLPSRYLSAQQEIRNAYQSKDSGRIKESYDLLRKIAENPVVQLIIREQFQHQKLLIYSIGASSTISTISLGLILTALRKKTNNPNEDSSSF